MFVLAFSLLVLLSCASASKPSDLIVVQSSPNETNTYSIKNEVYQFMMVPLYWVPLQVNRHVIYTATNQTVAALTTNVMTKKRSVMLNPEDYEIVSALVGDMPNNVGVDTKKRSILSDGGVRRIDLDHESFLIITEPVDTTKRQVPLGGKVCLHVPFFTSCDNSVDLDQVKTALQAQNAELRAELDSYKRTNDQRDNELAISLSKQRDLVQAIANQQQQQLSMIQRLTIMSKTNLVQTQHGDQIVHSQINSLKRMTNSLLRFSNAIGSTDPRTVVAQPAMANLFRGYTSLLSLFASPSNSEVRIPIVDSRTFNFSELVLPNEAVKNVSPPNTNAPEKDLSNYRGFTVTMSYQCSSLTVTSENYCNASTSTTNPNPKSIQTGGWIYGPFHTNHWGLYIVQNSNGPDTLSRESGIVVPQQPASPFPSSGGVDVLHCVNFLGFNVLARFTTTPFLLNGIPAGTAPLPLEACNNYRLFAVGSVTHYRLFALTEGITVPFYSNCNRETLYSLGLSNPTGYLSRYPDVTGPMDSTDTHLFQLYAQHWVSPTCYINIEPEWIGLTYYIKNDPVVVPNVPRGYKFNQFTVNPQGELASSLEFVYTPQWALVYEIVRISNDLNSTSGNRVIVDEIDILDGESVLFLQTSNGTIIDESDNMFGLGNNGRDCVQVPIETDFANMTFDHDLTDCFFQNDQVGYPASTYLQGVVKTSGISRFPNKFELNLVNDTILGFPSYRFNLTPRAGADFRFYVSSKPDTCATILKRKVDDAGCTFNFFYTGSEPVSLGGQTVTFDSNKLGSATIEPTPNPVQLSVGSRNCLTVTCRRTLNSTYVVLDTPKFEVVSQDDLSMNAAVQSSLDTLMAGSLASLKKMEGDIQTAKDKIAYYNNLLSTIDFNVSKLFPYENFTSLRNQVDAITDKINSNYCAGPFQSIECWLKDLASTVLATVVALVIVVLVAVFLFKTNAGRRLRSKMCSPGDASESPSGFLDTYGASPAEFQLTATN